MNDRMEQNLRTATSTNVDEAILITPRTTSRVVVPDQPTSEPTLGALFVELSDDLSHLVRQELALAKSEISENFNRGRQGVVLIAAGGLFAFAGVLVLLAAAVIGLGAAIDSYGLAALIVGAVVVVIGLMLYFSGKGKLDRVNLIPEKAIDSLERDAKMAKEKLS